jgi:hypothetical protein
MGSDVFKSMSMTRIATLIGSAIRRVGVVMPAIRNTVAASLIDAHERLGAAAVTIVVDCDEEVFRLGYGEIGALRLLSERNVEVRQCSGLRIGVLVVDEKAWVFAPTALYVQSEVHSDETPNAVELKAADVERIVWRLIPDQRPVLSDDLPPGLREEARHAEIEVGATAVSVEQLARTATALEVAPPLPFDVTRQVRVFHPYIQYVEISLTGCAIQRRRVEIPRSIQRIGAGDEIQRRLRTTFDLIERESSVSSKALEDELRQIRDDFTRSLGPPWGRVLLRSARPRFDKRIEAFRATLLKHKTQVEAGLKAMLSKSREQVLSYYLPLVKVSPPDALLGQMLFQDDKSTRSWLDSELSGTFPSPEDLLTEMKLDVQFRDVTYETLTQEGFAAALQKAYPHVDWKKPFDEFSAAKEREHQSKSVQ